MEWIRFIRSSSLGKKKGYTLLEYCAGAAIIAGIIWVAPNALGGSLSGFIGNLATWVNQRSSELELSS